MQRIMPSELPRSVLWVPGIVGVFRLFGVPRVQRVRIVLRRRVSGVQFFLRFRVCLISRRVQWVRFLMQWELLFFMFRLWRVPRELRKFLFWVRRLPGAV